MNLDLNIDDEREMIDRTNCGKILDVDPIVQYSENWCYASVIQMII